MLLIEPGRQTMVQASIHKQPDPRTAPNLADHATRVARFSWPDAAGLLDGLPGGGDQ